MAPSKVFYELLLQGNNLRQKGEYIQAIEVYRKAINQFGESVDIVRVIANCFFEAALHGGDEEYFQPAIRYIRDAIRMMPDNDQLYEELGTILSLGTLEYKAAAEAYRTAISLNSNNWRALFNGSGLYGVPEEVVSIQEAILWLERLVKLQPDNPDYHLRLGGLYYDMKNWDKAKVELTEALLCPKPLAEGSAKHLNNLLITIGD